MTDHLPQTRPRPSGAESLPAWVTSWDPWEPTPKEATAARLDEAMVRARAALTPCPPKALAVLLERLFRTSAAFGAKADVSALTEIYRVTLGPMPADLLAVAVERLMSRFAWWGVRLPTPVEVRETVGDELGARMVALNRLKLMASKVGLR